MYISSAALTASMRSSIMNTQSDLATAQTELASGTYADLGLHLGGSSGDLLALSQQQSRLTAYADTNALVTTRLTSTQSALSTLQSTATTFLQALTTASTSGMPTGGLQATAAGNLSALVATLNTTVGGQAIFGGINTGSVPIADYTATSAAKTAVDSAFSAAFGTTATSSGAASITAAQMTSFVSGAFASLFSPSSYAANWSSASDTAQTTEIAPGQTTTTSVSANDSAFRALAQAYTMISEFTTGSSLSDSAQKAVVASAVTAVTQALASLTNTQAAVGVAQNAITAATGQTSAQLAVLTTQAGTMQDVDVYALNTRITSLQTQIEASYELTSQMKALTLTNYLT